MINNENLSGDPNWERKLLEKVLLASLKEQRRQRRWSTFFKLLFFTYFFAVLWLFWPHEAITTPGKGKAHVSLIDVRGPIDDSAASNADDIIDSLQQAFKDKETQAVILRINSPGGSPVQASIIYNQIRYLRARHEKIKIYTVCTDLCTSAAYYIASATDAIYANPSSLVGSIGVLMDGFGFADGMHKIGVQRRLITSGNHKGFLDPFSPLKTEDEKFAQALLDNVHQQFIDKVKEGRGARLQNTPDIFSGLVWTGAQALPLGLIDGYGDLYTVARDVIKNKIIVDYTVKPGLIEQLTDRLGASFSKEIGSELGFSHKTLH